MNERAEAEHECGRYQLKAITPRCRKVMTVVEQANNRQGGSDQWKSIDSEALTTEQRYPGKDRTNCNKRNTPATRSGLKVRTPRIGLVDQSAQLRYQGIEE